MSTSMVFEFLPIVLVGLAAIGIIIWVQWAARQRREAMMRVAAGLGLSYADQDPALVRDFAHMEPILSGRGSRRRARHAMRGSYRGRDVAWFEFVYTVSTGKSSHDVLHSVAIARLARPVPAVQIVPEHFGHKVWDAMGGDDIDFESDEFSRKFWVTSDNRRFAYDLIHPRTMEFLLQVPEGRWHVAGPYVCFYLKGKPEPRQVQPMLDTLGMFLDLTPAHLASA